jgi:hypothetical protein
MQVEDRRRSASVNDLLPLNLNRKINLLDTSIKEEQAESESESGSISSEPKASQSIDEIKNLLSIQSEKVSLP